MKNPFSENDSFAVKLDVLDRIGSIFPDSILLDTQYRIISVSLNILEATGYTREELHQKSISIFSYGYSLDKLIAEKITPGFFEEEEFEIWTKSGRSIAYSLSGFYLKLVTEGDGSIVLKFRNLDEMKMTYNKLDAKAVELDNFVYLSAHALRGPLATIKGLINISKTCNDLEEREFLLHQMETFAENLDDKLHRLIQFAESDKGHESTIVRDLTLYDVAASLTATITEGNVNHPIRFSCEAGDQAVTIKNVEIVLSLLRNLVLFFCQQPKDADNSLVLDVHATQTSTEIILRGRKFVLSNSIKDRLKTMNIGYSEILNYPEMINFYAAKKVVFKLNGSIEFILTPLHEVVVLVTIPG